MLNVFIIRFRFDLYLTLIWQSVLATNFTATYTLYAEGWINRISDMRDSTVLPNTVYIFKLHLNKHIVVMTGKIYIPNELFCSTFNF